ncbi:MAG TPA: hypothetical protein VFS05_06555 [Gemmatimonadaceae bacterium]|nr:hypothetical protein [Gemmatimonadaceae bacterium]
MEAHVTAKSQSFRLRERASEAQIRHGEEVRADVPHVRVGAMSAALGWRMEPSPDGELFFCNMGRIRVRETLVHGDETPLPASAAVEGLEVPGPGYYDLLNVLIRSNGDIRLVVDEKTRVAPAPRELDEAWY